MSDEHANGQIQAGLPEGWVWTTLGEVCDPPQYGWTTSAEATGSLQLLRTTDITGGAIDWDTVPFCRDEPANVDKYLLHDGDIVISRAGSVGHSRLVRLPRRAVFASYLIRFRPLIDKEYVAYFLQSPAYWQAISEKTLGIAIPNVNATKLRQVAFPLAPSEEQRRIVTKLDELLTRLDAGVASLKRVQAALKRYRAAVLKAACEGRLVPQDSNDEPAEKLLDRILAERRAKWEADLRAKGKDPKKAKYVEPARPETEGLPELPEGWCWATWGQVSNWVTYGFTRPMPHVDIGVPIVTAKNIKNGRIDFGNTDKTTDAAFRDLSEKDRPRRGDILITKDGTLGRAAVVGDDSEFCINQSVAVLWLRSCPLDRNYLRIATESPDTQKRVTAKARGVAIKHLSITDFARMPFPLPPISEQRRIVDEVERQLSVAEYLETSSANNIERAEGMRQAILRGAFEGKLVAQDPSDEPARVMLERVQRRRETAATDNGEGAGRRGRQQRLPL